MKTLLGFFLTVVVVAGLASFCTLRWASSRPSEEAEHAWLHSELHLTDQQKAALAPIEAQFEAQEQALQAGLRAANHDLATALGQDKADTPRVRTAIEMVHHRMGDLQKASIEHVFAMRGVLTRAQGDQLLRLAQQALEHNP